MVAVFERLARKLDEFVEGYPATDSGVEIKILQRIFTPEQAEMALNLTPLPETAGQIAARLEKPLEDVKALLETMLNKGLIGGKALAEQQGYKLEPFLVGIFEHYTFINTDKLFAELYEEYLPVLSRALGGHQPRFGRVLPVLEHIEPGTEIHLYDDVRKMFESGLVFFQVLECVCRKTRALTGHPCKIDPEHKLGCVAWLAEPSEENLDTGVPVPLKMITKEEAIGVLDEAVKKGLIPSMYLNVQNYGPLMSVCFCCPCCCTLLRAQTQQQVPFSFGRTNYFASIDQEACTGCGACIDRCAFTAITASEDTYKVSSDTCIGCGSCTVTCPVEAITLFERPEAERETAPIDTRQWREKRAANRDAD